jgi:hypothetical protein
MIPVFLDSSDIVEMTGLHERGRLAPRVGHFISLS